MANNHSGHKDMANNAANKALPFIAAKYEGRQAAVRRTTDYPVSVNKSNESKT
jgi:hypothetical protein